MKSVFSRLGRVRSSRTSDPRAAILDDGAREALAERKKGDDQKAEALDYATRKLYREFYLRFYNQLGNGAPGAHWTYEPSKVPPLTNFQPGKLVGGRTARLELDATFTCEGIDYRTAMRFGRSYVDWHRTWEVRKRTRWGGSKWTSVRTPGDVFKALN